MQQAHARGPSMQMWLLAVVLAVVHGGATRQEPGGDAGVSLSEVECMCHFGEDKESDGGGGDCLLDYQCPEATPNCTGYKWNIKWGRCTTDGVDPDSYDWHDSYANLGYNFEGYDTQGIFARDGCVPGCDSAWLEDGECDETCNAPECNYDGSDCPGGDDIGECYTQADASDYRGLVHTTTEGLTCQKWSHQYPQTHTRSHANYPDAGLGGHNACRNPDGDAHAWCFTTNAEVRWGYCDVGPPQPSCYNTLHDNTECYRRSDGADYRGTISTTRGGVRCQRWSDHSPQAHTVTPAAYPRAGLGDHNYCRNPNGEQRPYCYTVDENLRWDYCDIPEPSTEPCSSPPPPPRHPPHLQDVAAVSPAENISHFNVTSSCNDACLPDRIGDGYCDQACYNPGCGWDKGDCRDKDGVRPCGEGCVPEMRGNGYCNSECNSESCEWDGEDCFHGHTECYQRANGTDYRGTVSHTRARKGVSLEATLCQRWSEQAPREHPFTYEKYPLDGLGGHNFCRNPGGKAKRPFCYTVGGDREWDYCDLPDPSTEPCYSPPPPPPPSPSPPWPPSPSPPPPPERAPISPAGLAALVAGSALGVCALVVLALRNRRSSLALARMQLELSKARAQSAQLAERDDSPEMSRGKMKGGSARTVRHDDNESAPPIALVVTSVSKKDVEVELDAPVGPEPGAP